MEHETFRSKPLTGLPIGLIRGFIFGNIGLLIGLALGMDDDMYIPLLLAAMILCGIIGVICRIGKKIEAGPDGIRINKKECLFAENDIYLRVYLHFYGVIPVTEKTLMLNGKSGKRNINCSFLGSQDTGRLAKILEDAMREKYRELYEKLVPEGNSLQSLQSFVIPAAELADKIHKHIRLHFRIMFIFLTVVFSMVLISSIAQDLLEEYWPVLLASMALDVLILGGTVLFIRRKFKASAENIPHEIMFFGGHCYIDGRSFGGSEVQRVVMTAIKNTGKEATRKLVIYERNGKSTEYSFGFKAGKETYGDYAQLLEAMKSNFADKFAYDFN